MRVPWATALAVLVALVVPGLIIVSGIRLLAHPALVRAEYRRSGFPVDSYGFTTAERVRLGLVGLHSVLPGGRGIALLRAARLPDGKPAFGPREIRHMTDVRTWIGRFWWFQYGALAVIALAGVLLLPRWLTRPLFPRGLRWGAVLTLVVAAALGAVMAVSWNTFFVDFHRLFFADDTWRFDDSTTLRRLYPDRLWVDVGIAAAAFTVAVALALLGVTTLWLRRLRY
jgi:integral membrane protein (TIGR01906 family)